MKLSVIVPCRERNERTEACLGEIRRQARVGGAELDLVVVTGVSPVGRARNEGLRRATGDYIAWVDDDDFVLKGWWREIVRALSGRPDVIVFGWRESQREVVPRLGTCPTAEDLRRTVLRDDFGGVRSYLWNKVFRRDLWEDIRFTDAMSVIDDYEILPMVLLKARSVAVLEFPLYDYRDNPQSLVRAMNPEKGKSMLDAACRRYAAWRESRFAAEARVAFVSLLYGWLAERLVSGDDPSADAFGLEIVRQLEAHRTDLLKMNALSISQRVKLLVACRRWWWLQRLVWKIHRVGKRT